MLRRNLVPWIVAGLVMAVLGVGSAFVLHDVESTDEELAATDAQLAIAVEELAEARGETQALTAAVDALRAQVEAAGEEPVAPAPDEIVEDAPGETPPRAAPPLTAAQIRAAVSAVFTDNPDVPEDQVVGAVTAYLTANPPPPGPPGEDADPPAEPREPTAEEIFIAVSAYCANDACRGPAGADGTDAPAVTDEQIAAQVAAYCDARGECIGPMGPMGPAGANGEDGRGVVDVDCNDDGDLVWTFDKPPLEDVIEDACQVPVLPPDPTDPPTSDPTEEP